MKNKILIPLALLCITILTNGCKDKKVEVTPGNQTQNATLRVVPTVGSSLMNFTSVNTTASGQKYTLSSLRYYVSNVRLVKADGTEYPIAGKYFLVNPATYDYDLGTVPVGDYKGIKFAVGIDSETNHKDPTVYPSNNPLAIQSPAIHWSWNSGYIFMMLEGSCDTTATNVDVLTYGQYSHGMFFHIGMDPLYREVDLSNSPFSVSAATPKTITMVSDVNKIFTNIDLRTENGSHTMGTMPLATRVANNIPTMFTVIQ